MEVPVNQTKNPNGFTVIEIGIILSLLLIVGYIAFPKYIDFTKRTKTETLKAHLGLLRSSIASKYTERALNGKTPLQPEKITKDFFSNMKIPIEPFANTSNIKVVATPISNKDFDNNGGWIYSKKTGQIIADYLDCRGKL